MNNKSILAKVAIIKNYRKRKHLCQLCGHAEENINHKCIENYIKSDTRDLSLEILINDPVFTEYERIIQEKENQQKQENKIDEKQTNFILAENKVKNDKYLLVLDFFNTELLKSKNIKIFISSVAKKHPTKMIIIGCSDKFIADGLRTYFKHITRSYNISIVPEISEKYINENLYLLVTNNKERYENIITQEKNCILIPEEISEEDLFKHINIFN